MGIILLIDSVPHKNLIHNLPDHGLIYFKQLDYGEDVCFISHDLRCHFWNVASIINDPNNLPHYISDPDAHFKIIQPTFAKQFRMLIKQPTFIQIKSHMRYHYDINKYVLLTRLLCQDVSYVIIDKLFWLEMNDIFVPQRPEIISEFGHHTDKVIEAFKNSIKKYPHNWMLL